MFLDRPTKATPRGLLAQLRMGLGALPDAELRAGNVRKRGYYDALAVSVPRGENRLVDAGHGALHTQQPDTVVAAIRDVLERASR